MENKKVISTIALADDDADDQFFFQLALKEATENVSLKIYNDGVKLLAALNQPETTLPDIIFMDLNMPKKNGIQCIEEIRLNEQLKYIPIVVLTTSTSQAEIAKAYAKGACLYILKPAEFSTLVALLKKVFSMNLTLARPALD